MKRWLCGALAALMALTTGCSAILNRDYTSVTPHSATPQADGESNTIRVGSYQELVNALIYLIGRGTEGGAIRFDGGDSDETAIQQMLDEACLEVVQEDPLGAYAVEYIKYSVTPIVGSYEANVQITYRRTREQVAAIVDATGTAAIRSELSEALSEFSSEVVLRISYFEEDSEYIRQLMRRGLPVQSGLRPGFPGRPDHHVPGDGAAADRGGAAHLPPVPARPWRAGATPFSGRRTAC